MWSLSFHGAGCVAHPTGVDPKGFPNRESTPKLGKRNQSEGVGVARTRIPRMNPWGAPIVKHICCPSCSVALNRGHVGSCYIPCWKKVGFVVPFCKQRGWNLEPAPAFCGGTEGV